MARIEDLHLPCQASSGGESDGVRVPLCRQLSRHPLHQRREHGQSRASAALSALLADSNQSQPRIHLHTARVHHARHI